MTTKKITCIELFSFKISILDGGGGRVSYQKAACYLSKHLKTTSKHRNTYNNIILLSRPETAQKAVNPLSTSRSPRAPPSFPITMEASQVWNVIWPKKNVSLTLHPPKPGLWVIYVNEIEKKKRREISKPASSGLPSQVTIPCFSIPGDVPRELIYHHLWGQENHLQNCFLMEYLTSLEGHNVFIWIKTFKFTRAASTLNFSKSYWLLWCHFYSTLHPLKKHWFWSFAFFQKKHLQLTRKIRHETHETL